MLVVGLIAVMFFAMLLKVACSIVDVRQPSWRNAAGIVLAAASIKALAKFCIATFLSNGSPARDGLLLLLIAPPLIAGVYSSRLDTEYWRGLAIWLIQVVIGGISLAVVILCLAMAGISLPRSSKSRASKPQQQQQSEATEPAERSSGVKD